MTGKDQSGRVYNSIGNITIFPAQCLGMGSHGTMVYAGEMHGRSVAVKRFLSAFYDAAHKEIQLLIDSDTHPNVLRYFAMESDVDFVYLALERCKASLANVVDFFNKIDTSDYSDDNSDISKLATTIYAGEKYEDFEVNHKLKSSRVRRPSFHPADVFHSHDAVSFSTLPSFIKRLISPSHVLVKWLHDCVAGLAYLHSLNIVHRDIKPHNILISLTNIAKICDMGLGKKLDVSNSSFGGTSAYGLRPMHTGKSARSTEIESDVSNTTGAAGSVVFKSFLTLS